MFALIDRQNLRVTRAAEHAEKYAARVAAAW
jgi:hypothetical protein